MKRDMDLARRILFAIEATPYERGHPGEMRLEGVDRETLSYHIMLLHEAGLIEAVDMTSMGPGGNWWEPRRLTWEGHEFLDRARSDTVWSKAKDFAIARGGGLAFATLKVALTAVIDQAMKGELKLPHA